MDATPSSPPPQEQPARLPRAGTFRQRRPMSTGQGGLRRGATFANRPQSFAADQNFSLLDVDSPEPVPRLRRGSSFVGRKENDDGKPQLRRASRRESDADPPFRRSIRAKEVETPPRPSLPRAGTFSFGTSQSPRVESVDSVRRMSSTDKVGRGRRSCGMCSSCETGSKAMPPWAPERMARMNAEEREEVLREMHHKEEMGRLEAELRKKRVEDMHAVSARLQVKRSLREDSDGESFPSSEEAAKDDDDYELESVDLGDRDGSRRDRTMSRSRSRSQSTSEKGSTQDKMEDLITSADVVGSVGVQRVVENCGQCHGLERKVTDLEEELAVLREVVKICEENEATEKQEEAEEGRRNHGKGWMGKIASAYYGSSAAASEKTRLKEEVEALRRATDFLFQKMQAAGN